MVEPRKPIPFTCNGPGEIIAPMNDSRSSPRPRSLVQRLYDPSVVERSAPRWPDALLRLLGEVATSGTAAVVPHVLMLIDDEDRRVAEASTGTIAGILTRISPARLLALDSILRGGASYPAPRRSTWNRLSPKRLDRQPAFGGFAPDLLGLASMHPSGYVREAALKRLAERDDGTEIPYLLVRANDWVAPVREAALAALRARLRPGYARHLVRSLPLVARLADCSRYDHAPLVADILGRLRDAESRPALLEGLSSADRAVRRACFRLAIEAVDLPLPEFLGGILRKDDPTLRLWAARTAAARLAVEDFLELVPVMRRDRFMPVRREALLGLVERSPDPAGPALRAALLDPNASIREVARHYLGKSGGFDARAYYREAVRSGTPDALPPALAGLGETGSGEDAESVVPWLNYPGTKIRRVAVRALGRLDGDARVGDLLRALEDERSSVGRAAREALRGRVHLVAGDRLWGVFVRARRPHVRRHVLPLLAGLGKWESLPYLIAACSADEPEVASRAQGYLGDWIGRFNRSFVKPSPEDVRRAETALEASGPALAPETVKVLQFHLKGW